MHAEDVHIYIWERVRVGEGDGGGGAAATSPRRTRGGRVAAPGTLGRTVRPKGSDSPIPFGLLLGRLLVGLRGEEGRGGGLPALGCKEGERGKREVG